jgi:hypothetical protein
MDAERTGKVVCVGEGTASPESASWPLTWDGRAFARATGDTGDTGNLFAIGPTPSGLFAKVDPCSAVVPGQRLAPVSAALVAYVDATYGAGIGPVEPAPDVRADR